MAGGQPRPAYRRMPRYRPAPEYPPLPEWWPADDRAALACPPVPGSPPGPGRRPAPGSPPPVAAWAAALGYLTVPLFPVPLVIYLATLRGPGWARGHAAQAVNVWLTGFLYDLSAVIMAAMLALGSPRAALLVFAPLIAARWLVTLAYLARAARAAGRGAACAFPAWLCMRVAR